MSDISFTVKADPDGKAKFRITIPVQYCTNEIFRDISLILTDEANQNIDVKKSNLQFEAEFEETIGEYRYSLVLKKNSDQIDNEEITVKIIPWEKQQDPDLVFRFRDTCSLYNKGEEKKISSVFFNRMDDHILVGENNNLNLYKNSTLEFVATLQGHSDSILKIIYDDSNRSYLTLGKEKIIRWDVKAQIPVEIVSEPYGYRHALDLFLNNGNLYWTFSRANEPFFEVTNLYDLNEKIKIDIKANQSPSKIKFDMGTGYLLFGNTPENSVQVFSLKEKMMIQNKLMLESGSINNIIVVPGGKHFMTHSHNSDHFKIWTFNDWKLIRKVPRRKVPGLYSSDSVIVDVILDADYSELIIVYQSGIIDVYDWYGIAD